MLAPINCKEDKLKWVKLNKKSIFQRNIATKIFSCHEVNIKATCTRAYLHTRKTLIFIKLQMKPLKIFFHTISNYERMNPVFYHGLTSILPKLSAYSSKQQNFSSYNSIPHDNHVISQMKPMNECKSYSFEQ